MFNFNKLLAPFFYSLVFFIIPLLAPAAEIKVDVLTDTGTDKANCELHSAIEAAITDSVVDGCQAGDASDEIVFGVTGTIELTRDLPLIDRELQINGPGSDQLLIAGGGSFNMIAFGANSGNSSIRGLSLAKGYSSGNGGCINANGHTTMVIEDMVIAKCHADGFGGGAAIIGGGSIARSYFQDNSSDSGGGGAFFSASPGSVADSTFESNSSTNGGGLYLNNQPVGLTRSTFQDNRATISGGAVSVNSADGLADISHSTIVGNMADSDSNSSGNGGGIAVIAGSLTLFNSIVAGNISNNGVSPQHDIALAIPEKVKTLGFNFVSTNQDIETEFPEGKPNAFGDFASTNASPFDPELLAIGNYGGPTRTMPPIDSSIVVDLGSCPGEAADQRGYSNPDTALRINDFPPDNAADGCDIGAVELPLVPEFIFDNGFETL